MTNLLTDMEALDTSGPEIADARQYITFACAGQNFGIDIMSIREIRNWSALTPLPAAKPDVLGVMEIRGRVVAVHDLALRIGCTTTRTTQQPGQVILILSIQGHDMGLLVDSVSDIIEVKENDKLPVPQIEGSAAKFLAGIARVDDDLVAILDEETVRNTSVEFAVATTDDLEAGVFTKADEGVETVYVD
ncbi:chemotaxis protein CheW [Devosia sp. XJ19-1]|uniref:Chemotaxis protein CheW n=1 Tax=Devosia ureilytica TaxID=2952754 RepID=A0A9Q4FR52_9HYPH|nr:chemotaxis protein CheW [Devosia ureilytica]MCP8883438.1 chemotaxis protein CheW [Devosia ureilytica]MCP8887046.1 chemotaxis protein CheW [Devosia ureilytica]